MVKTQCGYLCRDYLLFHVYDNVINVCLYNVYFRFFAHLVIGTFTGEHCWFHALCIYRCEISLKDGDVDRQNDYFIHVSTINIKVYYIYFTENLNTRKEFERIEYYRDCSIH